MQGEEQKKLDLITNDVLKDALRYTGKVGLAASEEEDEPMLVEEAYGSKRRAAQKPVRVRRRSDEAKALDLASRHALEPRYVAVFDPLDGSSNIDCNAPAGVGINAAVRGP